MLCGKKAFVHEEALARELAADFYAQRKRHHLAYDYLKEGKRTRNTTRKMLFVIVFIVDDEGFTS